MLMDWWLMDAPPLPLLILAGVLLAIASNRDKRIRVSRDSAISQPQSATANPNASASKTSPHSVSRDMVQPDSVTSLSSNTGQKKIAKSLATKTVKSKTVNSSQEKEKGRSPVLPKVSAPSDSPPSVPISFTIETPEEPKSKGSQD